MRDPQSISVTILGSRGNVRPSARRHTRHSGVLVGGELLLDVGEKSFLRYHPRWVLITHFHVDHAFFVEEPLPELPRVFAPEPQKNCDARIVPSGQRLRLGQWTVTPIPTIHSHRVRSLGYRVEQYGGALKLYREAIASGTHASTNEYRPLFESAIREFEDWLSGQ